MGKHLVPLISPVVVGRERELDALERHLVRGQPRTLLISGEAGIGKSRLVGEAHAMAARLGLWCLQSACFESDRALPYAPFLDLLRPLLSPTPSGSAGAAEPVPRAIDVEPVAAHLAELASLLPELGMLAGQPAPHLEPEQRKRRIFYVLADLFTRLAEDRPLVLTVEDLDWSDEASLDLLAHLSRQLARGPEESRVRLLLTYRSDETVQPLAHFLAELDRGKLAEEISLSGLARADVARLVQSILGLDRPAPADLIDALDRLAEGNPFFLEEILRSLLSMGDLSIEGGILRGSPRADLRIPRTVDDAVRRRASTLGEPARRLLVVASVVGRRFDFALLQELGQVIGQQPGGCDEASLLDLVRELIGQQFVVEESPDRFAFRHALTRQAIYGDLLSREARELHRAVVQAGERLYGDAWEARAGELAYHASAADDPERVLRYSEAAGSAALASYAPLTALDHLTRAIDAAHRLARPVPPALLRGRARTHELLGSFEGARADYEDAAWLARAQGDARAEWEALLDLGLLWSARDYARTGEYVEQALTRARTLNDPAAIAGTLNRLGNWHTNVGRSGESARHHAEALEIFERLGDRRGVAETLDLLGMASALRGDLLGAATHYDRAIPILADLDDRERLVTGLTVWVLASGYYWADTTAWATLDQAECDRRWERALAIARESSWRSGEAFVLYEVALWLGPRGEYALALRFAEAARAIAEEIGHRQWQAGALATLGALHLDVLDLAGARDLLESAAGMSREIGSAIWSQIVAGYLATTCVRMRDLDGAARVLEDASAPEPPECRPMATLGERLCWCARAELLMASGNPSEALGVVDRLIESTAAPDVVVPRLWHLRGEALAALGRSPEALAALGAARAAALQRGLKPQLWRIAAALGRVHRRGRQHAEAQQAFSEARATVEELAAGVPSDALAGQFRERALAPLPPSRPPSPREALRQAYGGLTGRERDVALRIARGMTNRAIAGDLVVSERTVESYVENILAKLGFESRSQVAAWAVEVGLVSRR